MTGQAILEGPARTAPSVPQEELARTQVQQGASVWGLLGLGLCTSLLMWLSFFPVAWGWIGWFALVPWLTLVRSSARPYKLYLISYLSAMVFYLAALRWMSVADYRMYATWIIVAVIISSYFPWALWILRFLDRRLPRLPLMVTFPVVWVALELVRVYFTGGFATRVLGHFQHDFPGGFSWYSLGYSQHAFLPVIQIADLTGVLGVSFVVALSNALLLEVLLGQGWFMRWLAPSNREPRSTWGGLVVHGLVFLGVLLATLGYGFWRLGQQTQTPGPRIALLQGNIDQRIRNEASSPDPKENAQAIRQLVFHFFHLNEVAASTQPDLIVWPETSTPGNWDETQDGSPTPSTRRWSNKLATASRTYLLFGLNASREYRKGKVHRYNSAVLLNRHGTFLGRYDKIHRVPFGEYVPFRESFPWLNSFAPYDFDYSVRPGEEFTRFCLPASQKPGSKEKSYTFGVLICYEDTDPDLTRPYGGGDGQPPVDFLLNISNDGWFDGSSEHDEHLAICRFRAIECRRSVARAVNMGISAVIDSNGRVLAPGKPRMISMRRDMPKVNLWEVPAQGARTLPISRWPEFKKDAGVLLAQIPIDTRASLYAHWGDWFPLGCWAVLLVLGVVACVPTSLIRMSRWSTS